MNSTLEVVLELRKDCLFLQLSGEYDFLRLLQIITQVGEQCRHSGCRRVLSDVRAHVGGIEVLELHHIGEHMAREIPRGCSVAVVVSERRLEMDRYLETVALNRGVLFHLFTKTEDAELWLKNPSSW